MKKRKIKLNRAKIGEWKIKSGCQAEAYPASMIGPKRTGPLSFHRQEREVTLLCEASLTRFPPPLKATDYGLSPTARGPTPYLEWADQFISPKGPTQWAEPAFNHLKALIRVTSPHYRARQLTLPPAASWRLRRITNLAMWDSCGILLIWIIIWKIYFRILCSNYLLLE